MRKKAIRDIHLERAKTTNMSRTVVDGDVNSEQFEGAEYTQTNHDSVVLEGVSLPEGDMECDELEEGEMQPSCSFGTSSAPTPYIDIGDFDTEVHTDRESDSDPEEGEKEDSLCKFLMDWNARHKITREAMKDLLAGLRNHGHPDVPLDPRTLLKTDVNYSVEEKCGGSYVYLSLAKSLRSALLKVNNVQIVNDSELHLQFNIDGVPIFNSSTQSLWPILCRVVKPFISPVCVIALYSGRKKPTSFNEFLQPLVNEILTIRANGFVVAADISCRLVVHSFVCDAPARSDVKGTRHVNFHQGCDKCIVEGIYTKERRMTFSDTASPKRSDSDFDLLLTPNEYRVKECVLRDINVGMVSQFPIDYMHLTLLGLVRRMARDWQDGVLHSKSFPFQVRRDTINSIQASIVNLAPRMPREFQRQCRALQECDSWKATEARQFLLYLGPVVLMDSLDARMYEHFKLLSICIRCLCCEKLLASYIDRVTIWLEKFVNDYSKFYGNKSVYSVHAHCHIVDDSRKFGVLDNFSGFPFESFLGTLKGMVRKSHQVVQQIVRRLSEKELSDGVPEKKLLLKHLHKRGPEIEGREDMLQYGSAQIGSIHLSNYSRDKRDCCFFVDGHICCIQNILAAANSNELHVVYSVYEDKRPLFREPISSEDVGIYCVSDLSDEVFFAVFDERWRKCVNLPLDVNNVVVLQLLHSS